MTTMRKMMPTSNPFLLITSLKVDVVLVENKLTLPRRLKSLRMPVMKWMKMMMMMMMMMTSMHPTMMKKCTVKLLLFWEGQLFSLPLLSLSKFPILSISSLPKEKSTKKTKNSQEKVWRTEAIDIQDASCNWTSKLICLLSYTTVTYLSLKKKYIS